MVARTITVEPVSTRKFPANGEINGKFRGVRAFGVILKADKHVNSEAYSKIPYSTE